MKTLIAVLTLTACTLRAEDLTHPVLSPMEKQYFDSGQFLLRYGTNQPSHHEIQQVNAPNGHAVTALIFFFGREDDAVAKNDAENLSRMGYTLKNGPAVLARHATDRYGFFLKKFPRARAFIDFYVRNGLPILAKHTSI
jgi:hypothetical protein